MDWNRKVTDGMTDLLHSTLYTRGDFSYITGRRELFGLAPQWCLSCLPCVYLLPRYSSSSSSCSLIHTFLLFVIVVAGSAMGGRFPSGMGKLIYGRATQPANRLPSHHIINNWGGSKRSRKNKKKKTGAPVSSNKCTASTTAAMALFSYFIL